MNGLNGHGRAVGVLSSSSLGFMIRMLHRYRMILVATTRVEFAKKYSGSVLGLLWVFLNPFLLLALYLFVYMVIFKMRFPGFSQMDYVLYVFTGLIPYLGFSEALTSGTVSIKQNIHLVKNVMLPIELIPVRVVIISMVTQFVGMGVLLFMTALNGNLSAHILWLPAVVVLQLLFMVGLVWILSALAVTLPDIGYFINLAMLFLLFVSPIGFKPEMVPDGFGFMLYINPIYYMTEMYRDSMLFGKLPDMLTTLVYVIVSIGSFAAGSSFFRRFKNVLVDYE